MIDFDDLAGMLGHHFTVPAEFVAGVLSTVNEDSLTILMQHFDGDTIIAMMDAAGVDPATTPPDEFRSALEAFAEVVSEATEGMAAPRPRSGSDTGQ